MGDTKTTVDGTGERLRALADALYDGNKSALARAIGMKPGSFSKYLRGKRKPGAAVLGRLVGLGVNLNWVLGGDGPMLIDPATERTEEAEGGADFVCRRWSHVSPRSFRAGASRGERGSPPG